MVVPEKDRQGPWEAASSPGNGVGTPDFLLSPLLLCAQIGADSYTHWEESYYLAQPLEGTG